MILSPKQIQALVDENNMLHRENALKLKQILDLEQLLYETRIIDLEDSSPCWCCMTEAVGDKNATHGETCVEARQATEMFWKGTK